MYSRRFSIPHMFLFSSAVATAIARACWHLRCRIYSPVEKQHTQDRKIKLRCRPVHMFLASGILQEYEGNARRHLEIFDDFSPTVNLCNRHAERSHSNQHVVSCNTIILSSRALQVGVKHTESGRAISVEEKNPYKECSSLSTSQMLSLYQFLWPWKAKLLASFHSLRIWSEPIQIVYPNGMENVYNQSRAFQSGHQLICERWSAPNKKFLSSSWFSFHTTLPFPDCNKSPYLSFYISNNCLNSHRII